MGKVEKFEFRCEAEHRLVSAPYTYVLVTPVKNEARFIPGTIASVIAQTSRPMEWVIVSDGSTDETDAIVARASQEHPWIHLLQLPQRNNRDFAAVVIATEAGFKALTCRDYRYLGLLDADVSFGSEYFTTIMDRFACNRRLGLAGGVVLDPDMPISAIPRNRFDVPGAVQFFRRECFESLGGLFAIPEGGWDALTCAKARMNGYQTALFVDLVVKHHKPRNIASGGILRRKWQLGVRDYALGYHPLFELAKCVSRLGERPRIIGAFAWWFGFCNACLRRRKRLLPSDLLAYVQREQFGRFLRPFTSKSA